MTLEEAIYREEALTYSFGERYKRGGEPIGELPKLEEEHRQLAEWLKELKMYKAVFEKVGMILYEYGYTMDDLETIFGKVNEEAKADADN